MLCLTLFSSSRWRYQRRDFSRISRPEHRASFSFSRSFRRLIWDGSMEENSLIRFTYRTKPLNHLRRFLARYQPTKWEMSTYFHFDCILSNKAKRCPLICNKNENNCWLSWYSQSLGICVLTRALTNKPDHQTSSLQPGVKHSAACCLPEAPRLCLSEQSQSTEQQEAFGSIVYTQLDYMYFKWAQTELTVLHQAGNHNI